jgi:hypothetical protein
VAHTASPRDTVVLVKMSASPPSNGSDKEALPTHDSEKGVGQTARRAGHDGVPENFREQDFMTRNGLNLRSFQKRKCDPHLQRRGAQMLIEISQVIGARARSSLIAL